MLLITTPNITADIKLLLDTANTFDWQVYSDGWRVPGHLFNRPGALCGSQSFCEVIANQMDWKLVSNPFDWISKIPEDYTFRKISCTTLSEARKIEEQKFIKTGSCNYSTWKVYESGKDLLDTSTYNKNIVIVSDVLKFTSKYRCFIKDRKVVAECCYWYQKHNMTAPEINKPENYDNNAEAVVNSVNTMLEDPRVECASACVIDVGRFRKDTYAVIDTKAPWISELYGCDPVAVLETIKAACIFGEK